MKALILAGGFATRLWPLTQHRAKPMLLIDGQPIIGHILEKIPLETEIYLLTNSHFAADFNAYIATLDRPIKVFCEDAHADDQKPGALAAVAMAIKYFKLDDDLLIVAGDNLLPALDFSRLTPQHASQAHLAVYALADAHQARSFGVVELAKKTATAHYEVLAFEEKPAEPKSNYVSTGFMSLGRELLAPLVEFSQQHPDALGAVVPELLTQKAEVLATLVEGDWFDVGSYEAYLAAHKTLQSTATLLDPTAQLINCQCQGKVYVAAGARAENCVLVDSVLYPGVKLKNCQVSQSVIDENCNFEKVDLNHKLVRANTSLRGE